MNEPGEGTQAPDFTLPGDNGSEIALASHRGSPVIVYFYPKDNTSGCTKQAEAFNAHYGEFLDAGVTIIGISPDPVASHDKFKAKYDLAFPLASDETTDVATAYGVWKEKSMYGRKYMGVERSTFLIARDGTIAKAWRKVKVPGHAEAVLKAVQEL
ncbi:peroxiredoxin [Acuticoccus sp. MNP-M23]|uniref:peroxiredoxin n=1 Tax=Acuticoccus sp. MNP-M23 TaxID=3072793 RepID=UPI002815AF8D|nr:peroxiredoxin [Acuticoccus sp. MNP-M23]WMS42537.1 peroxiredoxin [Acuticoccus sp. MNP-M23]